METIESHKTTMLGLIKEYTAELVSGGMALILSMTSKYSAFISAVWLANVGDMELHYSIVSVILTVGPSLLVGILVHVFKKFFDEWHQERKERKKNQSPKNLPE